MTFQEERRSMNRFCGGVILFLLLACASLAWGQDRSNSEGFASGGFASESFNPASLANCELWLDAGHAAFVTLRASQYVTDWLDRSGNSRDASQSTEAMQPEYVSDVLNGKPVLRFDGTDDLLETTAFDLNQPSTVFIVAKWNATELTQLMDGLAVNTRGLERTAAGTLRMFAGAALDTTGRTPESWHIYGTVWNGASSALREDGTQVNSGDAGSSAASGMTIAANGSQGADANADVAEIIAYSRVLTDAEMARVERYLSKKWGIALQ